MALQTRDAIMMIVAFFLGLLIVSALVSQPQKTNSGTEKNSAQTIEQKPVKDVKERIPIVSISLLQNGRLLVLLQNGTVLLCEEQGGSLKVLGEYNVVRLDGKTTFENLRDETMAVPEKHKDEGGGAKQ